MSFHVGELSQFTARNNSTWKFYELSKFFAKNSEIPGNSRREFLKWRIPGNSREFPNGNYRWP